MQRIRLLLVAAAVVLVSFVGFSNPASARASQTPATTSEATTTSESSNYKDSFTEECAKSLSEGGTIDDCQAADNPLFPAPHELLYGALAFAIVFGFLWKMGMPAIKAGTAARTERIKADLDAAEAQRTEASTILAEYQAQLADARTESARIIEEARQAADEVRAGLQAKAEADIAELRTKALADIEAAKAQIGDDLRREVTALAIGAAEQVVGRSLDQDTNVALVEAYINQVGANS